MDRFEAFLLLKQLLREPANRRRARQGETLMELFAIELRQEVESWAVAGLMLHADVELTEHNPAARGRVAAEQGRADGLAPELATALERCFDDAAPPTPLSDALWLTHWLGAHAGAACSPEELELCRGAGDAEGERLDGALRRLQLSTQRVGEIFAQAQRALERQP